MVTGHKLTSNGQFCIYSMLCVDKPFDLYRSVTTQQVRGSGMTCNNI